MLGDFLFTNVTNMVFLNALQTRKASHISTSNIDHARLGYV